jgi:glycosyltransferase involved in cell wall biosynthesis
MRICFLIRDYSTMTGFVGGTTIRYAALGQELARLGDEVHAVTATIAPSREIDDAGVRVHLVHQPHPDRLSFLAESSWTVAAHRVLRRLGPFDVVYAGEWGGDAWRHAVARNRGALITNLVTSLEQILEISPGLHRSPPVRVQHAIQRRLERGQARRSDALVACSQAVLDWSRELWGLDGIPAEVIPNFIDVEGVRRLAAAGEPPAGFPERGEVVLFSGRLESRKGVHVLVEAMRQVWRTHQDAQLVLIGADSGWEGGSMADHLRDLAGASIDRLHILGYQPPERLFPALARAEVVALPSLWEAFGIAALEAMAVGRSPILTRGSGFREFFREDKDGLMVPPGDSGALAAAITRLLDEPQLRASLQAAASKRSEAFDVRAMAPRHLALFEEVASASGSSGPPTRPSAGIL